MCTHGSNGFSCTARSLGIKTNNNNKNNETQHVVVSRRIPIVLYTYNKTRERGRGCTTISRYGRVTAVTARVSKGMLVSRASSGDRCCQYVQGLSVATFFSCAYDRWNWDLSLDKSCIRLIFLFFFIFYLIKTREFQPWSDPRII